MMDKFKVLLFVAVYLQYCQAATPFDIAKKVAEKLYTDKDFFFNWDYGGAIIFDSLYLSDENFHTNYTGIIDAWLDSQLTNPDSVGYRILNNIYFNNADAVGDIVGLFPINYLTRLIREKDGALKFNKTAYWELINITAINYVMGWPETLPDGTFSRHERGNWADQPDKNASFVWADDQFMGTALLARLSIAYNDKNLAEFVASQAIQFSKYLQDPQDELQYHGYNHATGQHSCCKWGRANGWGLMSHIEVLNALDKVDNLRSSDIRAQVLDIYKRHARAMIRTQGIDGRWHQIIDDHSTYPETSVTSMTLYALTRGVLSGWLEREPVVNKAILKAWDGIQIAISSDGTVDGICQGTGIQNDVASYEARGTSYYNSSPGLGSILYAANYLEFYLKKAYKHKL